MNKRLIRLTESDLHRIVKESVQKILKESSIMTPYGAYTYNDSDFDTMINQIEDPTIKKNYLNTFDAIRKYYPIWCEQNGVECNVDEVITKIKKFCGYPYNASLSEAFGRFLPLDFVDLLRRKLYT